MRFACLVCGCLRSVCVSGLWLVLLASQLWLVIGLEVGVLCVAICCLFVLAGCVLFLCLSLVVWLFVLFDWFKRYVGSCWFIFCLIYLDVCLLGGCIGALTFVVDFSWLLLRVVWFGLVYLLVICSLGVWLLVVYWLGGGFAALMLV